MSTTAELVQAYRTARNSSILHGTALRVHALSSAKRYRMLRGETEQKTIANELGITTAAICHFEKRRLKYLSDDLIATLVEFYESLGAKHER